VLFGTVTRFGISVDHKEKEDYASKVLTLTHMSVASSPPYLLSFNRLDEKSLISPFTTNFLNYRELSRPGRPIRLGIRAFEHSSIACTCPGAERNFLHLILHGAMVCYA
jgi:hypothetical protein